MTSLTRFAFGVLPTLLLMACGGKVGIDEGDASPGSDSGSSEVTPGEDVSPGEDATPGEDVTPGDDVGPGGCGFGACAPGTSCFDGCNECKCIMSGSWSCTDRPCADAGPPPPPPCPSFIPADRTVCFSEGQYCEYKNMCGGADTATCVLGPMGTVWLTRRETCPSPTCPAVQPKPMTPCSGVTKCGYSNGCGGTNVAYCDGKYWNVENGPCVSPGCPFSQPIEGTACTGPNKCSYPNGCGGYNTALCESSMTTWKIYRGDCPPPPPPPPMCPASMPPPGSPCTSGSSCSWNNGCGGLTYGYCSGGVWSMKPEGCVPGCPSTKPVSGVSCKPVSSSMCRYLVTGSTSCTSQCFCAEDGRWACYTPPCMGGGAVPPSDTPG
jgi:hypothetical protein